MKYKKFWRKGKIKCNLFHNKHVETIIEVISRSGTKLTCLYQYLNQLQFGKRQHLVHHSRIVYSNFIKYIFFYCQLPFTKGEKVIII